MAGAQRSKRPGEISGEPETHRGVAREPEASVKVQTDECWKRNASPVVDGSTEGNICIQTAEVPAAVEEHEELHVVAAFYASPWRVRHEPMRQSNEFAQLGPKARLDSENDFQSESHLSL